jgi:hypothetical protein
MKSFAPSAVSGTIYDRPSIKIVMSSIAWCSAGGGEEILPQALAGVDLYAARHHHRSAEKLWGGLAAPLSEEPRGAFALPDPPARAAHGAMHVPGTGPAVSLHVWPHDLALPPAASSALGPRIPSRETTTVPSLAGGDKFSHGYIRDGRTPPLSLFCLEGSAGGINLTGLLRRLVMEPRGVLDPTAASNAAHPSPPGGPSPAGSPRSWCTRSSRPSAPAGPARRTAPARR